MRTTKKTFSGTVEKMKANFRKELEKQGFRPEKLKDNNGNDFIGWSLDDKAKEKAKAKERLEYLRGEIENECISQAEIAELESLKEYIDADDVKLLEWAGVPENNQSIQ